MNFIINNQENFQTNSSTHNINTQNKHHLHRPNANLSCFQNSKFYAGIKMVNSLPPSLTILKNDKAKFKAALRQYLNAQSAYSADEFLCAQWHIIQFCKNVLSILQCTNCVYLCIYGLFHILLSLWHPYKCMECMHICMYVRTYACIMYVRMCITLYWNSINCWLSRETCCFLLYG